MIVRAIRAEDAADLNRMRTTDGVRENILGIKSERVSDSEAFIRALTPNDHLLVAEVDGGVVGCVGLSVPPGARVRHTGSVGIMVHVDYQGRGIGRALMTAILDLADRWLMLKRVELCVFTGNERALALYRSLGFVVEGTKKYAAVREGVYADEYLMARYRDVSPDGR
jgi:putative acetyltransferase